MKHRISIVILCLLCFSTLVAQEQDKIDLVGVSFIHNPEVGLKDPQSTQLENLKLNVTELNAFVKLPIKLKNEKTVLINALKWHYVKTPFDDLTSDISFEANLHSIQYDLTIIHKLSQKWSVLASLRPTLASNFKDGITSDDFFFQGMLAFRVAPSSMMKYGVGVSYSNGFGEPKTVPVLLFDYKTDKFKTEVKAPILLRLNYQAKKMAYGLQAKLEGGQFHLSSKENDGPIISNQDAIKFSRYNIGPTLGWNFDKNSRFEISAGISLKRTLRAIDNSGAEIDYDLKNGLFLKTGFYFGK